MPRSPTRRSRRGFSTGGPVQGVRRQVAVNSFVGLLEGAREILVPEIARRRTAPAGTGTLVPVEPGPLISVRLPTVSAARDR